MSKEPQTYETVEELYRADERRRFSPETDLGAQWRRPGTRGLSRLVWLEDTGELVAIPTRKQRGEGVVEVLADIADWDELEERLAGRESETSLDWVRRRLARR